MEIYTDGACSGNPGPGGTGVVILKNGAVIAEINKGYTRTTNNRMEYRAVMQGLRYAIGHGATAVTIYTDSQYVLKSMNEWCEKWKRQGWCRDKAGRQPVKNRDLVVALYALTKQINVRWVWVRGHDGNQWNERADQLAVAAAKDFTRHVPDTPTPTDAPQSTLF